MFNIYSTKIDVVVSDALTIEADGLLIPANDHLWMGAGVGGALKKDGGEEIEIEAVKQGPAALGEVVVTDAGALAFRKVFHAVISGQDLKIQPDKIGPAVCSALEVAGGSKIKKIVIAPLESGAAIGALTDAIAELASALLDNLGEKNSPQEIVLAVTDEEMRKTAREVLMKTLTGGG